MTYCQCHGQMTPYVLNRKVLNSLYGPQTSHASQTSILHIARTFHVYCCVRHPVCEVRQWDARLAVTWQVWSKRRHLTPCSPAPWDWLDHRPDTLPPPPLNLPHGLICRENPGEPIDRWKASMHEADPIGYRRKVNWPHGTQRRL